MSLVDLEDSLQAERRQEYGAASAIVEAYFADTGTIDGDHLSETIERIAVENNVSEPAVQTAVFRLIEEDRIAYT